MLAPERYLPSIWFSSIFLAITGAAILCTISKALCLLPVIEVPHSFINPTISTSPPLAKHLDKN
jgi:hypothetical protein